MLAEDGQTKAVRLAPTVRRSPLVFMRLHIFDTCSRYAPNSGASTSRTQFGTYGVLWYDWIRSNRLHVIGSHSCATSRGLDLRKSDSWSWESADSQVADYDQPTTGRSDGDEITSSSKAHNIVFSHYTTRLLDSFIRPSATPQGQQLSTH